MYDPGRQQSRLCMMESLSITRGVGNVGFNQDHQPLAIDVSFSFVDMSSIMHVDISSGFGFFDQDGAFDEQNSFSDYMAVLAALGVKEQIYAATRSKLVIARQIRKLETLKSPAMWAMMVHDKTPIKLLDMFYTGSAIIPSNGF